MFRRTQRWSLFSEELTSLYRPGPVWRPTPAWYRLGIALNWLGVDSEAGARQLKHKSVSRREESSGWDATYPMARPSAIVRNRQNLETIG